MALKKLGSAGRLGSRYGRRIKKRILDVEKLQRGRHKCPYCAKIAVKRLSAGIWECNKCDAKFAGKAYEPGVKA